MLLIAYDGSDHAKAAIEAAAKLMPGADAVVVTVWERYIDGLARAGAVGIGGIADDAGADFDKHFEAHAQRMASEGAAAANARGLKATPRTEAGPGAPAATILNVADHLGADAIVLGSRGHGRISALLLGSTSNQVLHHAARPVLVVPGPADD
ncbi:MAG: universal stress protein [Solirubrobacteraceae bacterium]|nr:universal stress protein [Solirubrobacteraceae bacterium]